MADNCITTALKKIKPLFIDDKRYLVVQGGMRSSKTYSIMLLIISWCQIYSDKVATIASMSYPHLSRGVIRDFQAIMKNADIWEPERWNQTSKIYTFGNGTILEFISVDNMSAHGPARDLLFVNEANDMDIETFRSLAFRTTGKIIIDYNPTHEFWAHTWLVKEEPQKTDFIILTYKDNEALAPTIRESIESRRPKPGEEPSNFWLVYGLGQIGSLEGNIYSGWEYLPAEEIRKGKLVRYGLDFGFSNDETALVAIYEMPDGKTGIIEMIYERGMLGSQYPSKLEEAGVEPNVLIVADAARPEIIAEIKQAGFRIIGADKSPGSVLRGIDYVSQCQIVYNGENLKKEYLSYAWRKKRSGEVLDEPQDGNDHCLPASQKVKTLKGDIPIGELVGKRGWIWSEYGKLRYFRNVRKTGEEVVYKFTLDDGSSFRCSGEHPIYTINRGPVPARLLTKKDKVQLYNYAREDHQRKQTRVGRACLGGGESLALRTWQARLSKEKADRKNLCALWEKILYNTILKDNSVLLTKLQNASKEKAPAGTSREYTSITSRETLGKEPVYCLDVYDTSNFALANGVVVSNCMDSVRYAISDLHRPVVQYGGIR